MTPITIYSMASCPFCERAKQLLKKWNITYQEIRIDQSEKGLNDMITITNGARSVPQIVVEGKWIGGFSELTELHMDGALDHLIK